MSKSYWLSNPLTGLTMQDIGVDVSFLNLKKYGKKYQYGKGTKILKYAEIMLTMHFANYIFSF